MFETRAHPMPHPASPDQRSPAARPRLTLVEAGRSCTLHDPVVVGREAGCDLRIDDSRVAERHAEVYPVGALWWIRDLGSEEGIYLDGEMVEAAPLAAHSRVRLGLAGPTLRLEC